MKIPLIGLTVLFLCVSCNKNKYATKPSISVKNINSSEILPGQTLEIYLEYTDKEGDLGKGELTYIRLRTNIKPIPNPAANDKADTVRYAIPDFPDKNKGQIQVNIPYFFLDEDPNDNDTMFFRISVKDIKGNASDTVSTPNVVARQN